MRGATLRNEIAILEQRLARIAQRGADARAEVARLLQADQHRPYDIAEARGVVAQAETESAKVQQQLDDLLIRLPTPAAIAAARARAEALLEEVSTAAQQHGAAWPSFVTAGLAIEAPARAVMAARANASRAMTALQALVTEFGVSDIAIPGEPVAPRKEQEAIALLLRLALDTAHGARAVDETVQRDLTAALREMEAQIAMSP